ncbi:WD40 repeat domain-containing protein [Phanerochaete sordida]|uniref:WD40 repeat domain-containing protein n=1 Tax=Phanerochaete sordida TaxID=48140 RepID=A0A9P3GP75_9APHY|nr:WD40 repeat domain-containing protein [Phanerochaete sordida]
MSQSTVADDDRDSSPPPPSQTTLGRKRSLSLSSEPDTDLEDIKRPRLTPSLSFTSSLNESFTSEVSLFSTSTPSSPRMCRTYSRRLRESTRPPALSASSSRTDLSLLSGRGRSDKDEALETGLAMMRETASVSSRATSPVVPVFPEPSARHHLKAGRLAIDFSVSTTATQEDPPTEENPFQGPSWPASWGVSNVLYFSRGNRVYLKNMSLNEDVAQMCKLKESHGDLRILECGGRDQANVLASATSKGYIQLWDVTARKSTLSWQCKGAVSMRWNGPVLTVGCLKGAVRHYDTRIATTSKMREQSRRAIRHQKPITSLAWNGEGKLLASGDDSGLILCWDDRMQMPLDVGEHNGRRKKMVHNGAITALAWCPWQPKVLASGDSTDEGAGTIRIWNVSGSSTQASSSHTSTYSSLYSYSSTYSTTSLARGSLTRSSSMTSLSSLSNRSFSTPFGPRQERSDRLDIGASVTSLHWSPHCKELLSTHGPGRAPAPNHLDADDADAPVAPLRHRFGNSVVVHQYPSLTPVTSLRVDGDDVGPANNAAGANTNANGAETGAAPPEDRAPRIAGSLLAPSGQKLLLALPAEGKLRVWDVWGKPSLRRQPSALNLEGRIR